jgi:hypothetical protein
MQRTTYLIINKFLATAAVRNTDLDKKGRENASHV